MPTETAVVKYNKDVAIIAALDEKYKGITIRPDNKDDYAIVKAGLKEYQTHRKEVTDWHQQGKAGIIKAGKAYDTEKNKWLALISPGENLLKYARQEEDRRVEAIDKKRIDELKVMVNDIKSYEYNLSGKTQPELQILKSQLETLSFEEEDYQEFLADAQAAAYNALRGIDEALKSRIKLDKAELERKVDADRLDKVRAEQEVAQKKIDADEKRLKEEKKKKDSMDMAFEDQKEWFKKHVKGDSFQTPNVDDLKKSIPALQAMAKHEVHEPSIQLLYDEQVIEADGILNFRKAEAKLQEEREALEADKQEEVDRKEREEFEKKAKIMAEREAVEKVEREHEEAEKKRVADEAEKKRQADLVPDRDKLLVLADILDEFIYPEFKDEKCRMIAHEAMKRVQDVSTWIRKECEDLWSSTY